MAPVRGLPLVLFHFTWVTAGGQPVLQHDDADQCSDAGDAQVVMLQNSIGLSGQDMSGAISEAESLTDADANANASASSAAPLHGYPGCPCIGISGRNGSILVNISNKNVSFPVDVGSTCQRWDLGRNPQCLGANSPLIDPAWCVSKWCIVDPCNCKLPNQKVVPKVSAYFPNSHVGGKAIYYSYEACGEDDTWTSGSNLQACVNQKTSSDCFKVAKCAWTVDQGCVGEELATTSCATDFTRNGVVWGMSDCPCIGFTNLTGFASANIVQGNSTIHVKYPASAGATCGAWDDNKHPDCTGPNKPDWCKKRWCNIDPCNCGIRTPPKLSTYFEGSLWAGHGLYYSYATCGEKDSYTWLNNPTACVNQMDQTSCGSQGSKCSWTVMNNKFMCLGKDLANLCYVPTPTGGASGRGGLFVAVLLLAAVLGLSHA